MKIRNDVAYAKNSKTRWIGHVMQYSDDRWTRAEADWIPQDDSRAPGRHRGDQTSSRKHESFEREEYHASRPSSEDDPLYYSGWRQGRMHSLLTSNLTDVYRCCRGDEAVNSLYVLSRHKTLLIAIKWERSGEDLCCINVIAKIAAVLVCFGQLVSKITADFPYRYHYSSPARPALRGGRTDMRTSL
uniref:Uncharacterized protein n=1 Tax=Haemonchus contortus TaxID=6289 RepID=A0A7I4Z2L0_HAECO